MQDSLFSPLWHRVAERRVQLRPQVQLRHRQFRDQSWYLLASAVTGRHHRINESGYEFIGRCDGTRTVQQVWDSLLDALGDDAPTQDEVIRILVELDREELLRYDAALDFPELFRRKVERDQRRLRGFVNPLAFRVPLGDPSALLARLDGLGRAVLHPGVFWVWLITIVCAVLAGAMHFPELREHVSNDFAAPRHFLLAWLIFPCVKLLHELGHALAVRRWGGEVRETGISLLVLVPAPYVDASAASGFRSRFQRVVVSAAGIMVELGIAAIALGVWLAVQPGLVRDIALVTLFICSVSTLLFNANPLLRFDGYYILCDALDLPNLASRSRAYWFARMEHVLRGTAPSAAVEPARGERKWLETYAPLAILNSLLIGTAIVLWVGSISLVLGTIAFVYVGIALVIVPLSRLLKRLLVGAPPGRARWRAGAIVVGTGVLASVLFFLIPIPFYTTAQGVIWVPDQAQVRPETDGFIQQWPVGDGERVEAGQVLVVLDDPALYAARAQLRSRLAGLETEQFESLLREPARVQNILQDIEQTRGELARVEQRIGFLKVRSQTSGTLVIPHQEDLRGTLARKGHVLGYVLDKDVQRVRAAVPEADAALVRDLTRTVEVRLAEAIGQVWPGRVEMDVPAATRELPSAALGDRGGGALATDPSEDKGLRTVEPIVLVDLRLPSVILRHIGERAWIRFDHGTMPFAQQFYRRLKLLFLQHFSPTG